jgi:hypothetical protein
MLPRCKGRSGRYSWCLHCAIGHESLRKVAIQGICKISYAAPKHFSLGKPFDHRDLDRQDTQRFFQKSEEGWNWLEHHTLNSADPKLHGGERKGLRPMHCSAARDGDASSKQRQLVNVTVNRVVEALAHNTYWEESPPTKVPEYHVLNLLRQLCPQILQPR